MRAGVGQFSSLQRRDFSWKEMKDELSTVLAESGVFALLPKLPSEGSEVLNVNLSLVDSGKGY